MAAKDDTKIKVLTTLPSTPFSMSAFRVPISTPRLLLRPLDALDLSAAHLLRTQSNVMKWTPVVTIDKDLDTTQTWLKEVSGPNDAKLYFFAICLHETGEMIGVGGSHRNGDGFPEVGYMIREEYWGKGPASEFLHAFVQAWWNLPRTQVELTVPQEAVIAPTASDHASAVSDSFLEQAPVRAVECLMGVTRIDNVPSRHVMKKAGFDLWSEQEWHNHNHAMGAVTVAKYRLRRP